MVVARCKDASADRERDVFQLWAIELFDRGVEGIAIDVHHDLR
jgi:hypothetical protein